MMQMPFRSPTDYYCKNLIPIDEQICGLLEKRKELSNNNPGFPSLEIISVWSQKYGLNENWLRRIFASYMFCEERLQPLVEPTGFLHFVSILKSVENDNMTYAITHMKQYRNATVVYVETEINTIEPFVILGHASFELLISPEYHCRQGSGTGHGKGMQHSFIVTPALPDDVSDLEFRLRVKPLPENPEFQKVSFKEATVTIK